MVYNHGAKITTRNQNNRIMIVIAKLFTLPRANGSYVLDESLMKEERPNKMVSAKTVTSINMNHRTAGKYYIVDEKSTIEYFAKQGKECVINFEDVIYNRYDPKKEYGHTVEKSFIDKLGRTSGVVSVGTPAKPIEPKKPKKAKNVDSSERDALANELTELSGEKVHHKLSIDKIKEQIQGFKNTKED